VSGFCASNSEEHRRKFFPAETKPKRISNLPHLRSSSSSQILSQHTEQKLRIALLQMQPPYYTPDGGMKRLRSIQFRILTGSKRDQQRIDNPLDLG